MPPEKRDDLSSPRALTALPVEEKRHRGCNCGRQTKTRTPPLLTDDLVIAARARAREPELPEATVAHALATPISAQLARYDVIVMSDEPENFERDTRIAAEFARHEHRVFHFAQHNDRQQRPTAPTLCRLLTPESRTDIRDTLTNLRESEGVDTAILFAPATFDPEIASEIRWRWGWRLVVAADAPAALLDRADVYLALNDVTAETSPERAVVMSSGTSWPERWASLDRAVRATWPRASIVVITWDNLAFTRMCLASVLENTEYPNYELIVVDNASTDGTVEELKRLSSIVPHVRTIHNSHNTGFAPANNQGLAAAAGDILVLLNNDTVVPRGWLTRLARHLEDPSVGLIGPGTNRTGNEAQIDIAYQTYGEFRAVARAQSQRHDGERYPIRMPMMFCLAFRRDTFERIGPLDEQYEVGMFEDEDYALRAKALGLDVTWTPEVYVHHAYHASIGKLLPTGEYMRLVKQNQRRFEEKWGICWERHRPVPAPTA